ncbi:hypothetical protein K3495_g6842 [Podosphaera aphanis]|nr:hypothetical protein K3495_g6842 [Podosphaera aphanis]
MTQPLIPRKGKDGIEGGKTKESSDPVPHQNGKKGTVIIPGGIKVLTISRLIVSGNMGVLENFSSKKGFTTTQVRVEREHEGFKGTGDQEIVWSVQKVSNKVVHFGTPHG